eukprot:GHVP01021513.1.p1 GENE.GHVP01021513.1~~GHVP01021513.1.p1  ORF type:complete len:328 (+),score=65.14 GHVP01021513.1:160-1143(+)
MFHMGNQNQSRKVTVIGASGEIGKILTVLLKEDTLIDHIALYDIANVGIAVDAMYIPTKVIISGHQGNPNDRENKELEMSLEGASYVIFIAGKPWTKGTTREEMFGFNAKIVVGVLDTLVKVCPEASLFVGTNPVNSIVPLIHLYYEKKGLNTPKVFGICTLDCIRARIIIGERLGRDPNEVNVEVIGGHSDSTMLPILSSIPGISLNEEEMCEIKEEVINCVYKVANAKDNKATASLSMAYAIRMFLNSFMHQEMGKEGEIPLIGYIKDREFGFISRRFTLSKDGYPVPKELPSMNQCEEKEFEKIKEALKKEHQAASEWFNINSR